MKNATILNERCDRGARETVRVDDIRCGDWYCAPNGGVHRVLGQLGFRTTHVDGTQTVGFAMKVNGKIKLVELDEHADHTIMCGHRPAVLRTQGLQWADILGVDRNRIFA